MKITHNNCEIIPVEYANSFLPENMIFKNCNTDKSRPIVFMIYLIKTDNRLILIDAGCDTMPGFDMRNFIGPCAALDKLGISPNDITDLLITHAHHDHIEAVGHFKNAKIYIQRDEYESGKKYLSQDMNVILFDDEINICENIKAIKIGGHSKGSCIAEIKCGDDTYIIAGDECYMRECLSKKIPTGTSYCPQKSEEFINKYSDDKFRVLLCHDL